MQGLIRQRSRILFVAVIALAGNALAGFAEAGGATTSGHAVKVVTAITFQRVSGHVASVQPGHDGSVSAQCPPSYNYLVSGGYAAHGNYVLVPPSVLTSKPEAGAPYWSAFLVNPKTAGTVDVAAIAICAHIEYATVISG